MKHITARRMIIMAVLLLLCLLIFMPLRIALGMSDLEQRGMSAKAAEGSVWSGKLRDLYIGELPLGDVNARLNPLPLLMGKTEIVVGREKSVAAHALSATIGGNSDALIVKNANADIAARGVFAPIPVSNIQLENVHAKIRGGKCAEASGTVRVNVGQNLLGMNLSRGLSGKITCRYGALFVPLAGESGLEKLALTIKEGGHYEAVFTVEGLPAETMSTLDALGFVASGNTVKLVAKGQF